MKEVISQDFMPIAWTQRIMTAVPPGNFLRQNHLFIPTVANVVEHLVQLSTNFASICRIKVNDFFSDLAATYDYLNLPDHVAEASTYLVERYNDTPIWLNDETSLKDITKLIHSHDKEASIDSLSWLASKSIIYGIRYDLPTNGIYSARQSLEPYGNLLKACGSHKSEPVKTDIEIPNVEIFPAYMLAKAKEMLGNPEKCDMTIRVDGEVYYAHRVFLRAVSTYFDRLTCGDWEEKRTGELNLDSNVYGTSESVKTVIEWVYSGRLSADDSILVDLEVVQKRLDVYLDVLALANVWDMPELTKHIEFRILNTGNSEINFVRVENVSDVLHMARRFNANGLAKHCVDFIEKNKVVIQLVESSPDPDYE